MVFSYSLPSDRSSSDRVSLWRRLRRLGAIRLTGGSHVLPLRDECVEAFQWLAQEVRQFQGDALVMRVDRFDGLSDTQLIRLFREARDHDYRQIELELAQLKKSGAAGKKLKEPSRILDGLRKLRKRHSDIGRVDFFESPSGARLGSRLAEFQQALFPIGDPAANVTPEAVSEYRRKRWVTRPRPHVDRLACAWLIRRFINPKASIRYSLKPESHEISFDMSKAHFGHLGNLCTFEVMVAAFGLNEPSVRPIAEIIHEIDLRDGHYARPEAAGVDAILKGWLLAGLSDAELESHGITLFEGLSRALAGSNRKLSTNLPKEVRT
ncbi:MAG: chromate resistance protein [Acidobacteria bacterium]|nr:chromate resistance protein [Acidobacteriota bacterium]